MTKTIATHVTIVSVNHVSDEEAEKLVEAKDAEDLQEVADGMGEDVRSLLRHRVFGDADEVPIMEVQPDVYEDWDGVDQ